MKRVSFVIAVLVGLSACSNTSNNVQPANKKSLYNKVENKEAIASDATEGEIKEELKWEEHIRKVRKLRKLRKKLYGKKKEETKKIKFCFEDEKSIHYRASERCK